MPNLPTFARRLRSSVLSPQSSIPAVLVFALAAVVLLRQAGRVGYNTDEGQFIATAQYFEFVVDGALTGPPWEETYWTLTQPPIPRYVLGAAIRLSGNPLPRVDLNHRIDEVRNKERYRDPRTFRDEARIAREREVARPSPAVLAAARVPMALFGAGAVALLFLIGRALGGTAAGLVASLGLLAAPLALTLLPRAHSEGPLLFFTLLGLYLGTRTADGGRRTTDHGPRATGNGRRATGDGQRATDHGRTMWGSALAAPLLAGVATGLAAATKLPAVLGLAALGGFAVWSLAVWRWSPARATVAWRGGALAAVFGVVVFVLVNPFLWPDPIGRSVAMLEFRRQELVGQRALNAGDAVPESLPTRALLLLERTFVTEAPLARRTGLPLDAVLAGVGTFGLGRRALRARREGGLVSREALVLVWVATFFAGTAPNLGLDWQRYYLPTVALGLLLVGVGASALLGTAVAAWDGRSPRVGPTAPPPVATA